MAITVLVIFVLWENHVNLLLQSFPVLIISLVTFIGNDENPRCNNKFTWCCHEAKLVQVYYFKKYDKRHAIQLSKT